MKVENRRALENAELTLQVPGIAFAEWGPGDMSMSFGYKSAPRDPHPPELQAARDRIFAACKKSDVAFLEGMTPENVAQRIAEGVMVSSGGQTEGATAAAGRAHTKRTMPV